MRKGNIFMKAEFIIFRHGETDWNRQHRSMGTTDIPLNATGKQQAERLAVRLAQEHISACYTSPLARAKETMCLVARYHHLPVWILEDLREMDLGQFEGKLKAERTLLFPGFDPGNDEHRELLHMDTFSLWIPRLKNEIVAGLLQRHDGQTIAISTHDQKMRALLIALGMPEETKRTVLKNSAVTKVSLENDAMTVMYHNDTSHLENINIEKQTL